MPRDLYEVLGVPGTASEAEIRHAFWTLAKRYHPDVNPGSPDAARRFVEVGSAAETLLDPRRRTAYDAARTPAPRAARPPAATPKPSPPPPAPTPAPKPGGDGRDGPWWGVVRALVVVAVAAYIATAHWWYQSPSSGQQNAGYPANGAVVWRASDFTLDDGWGINLAGQGARIQIFPGTSTDIEYAGGSLSSAGNIALLPKGESLTYQHCASAIRQAAGQSGAADQITPTTGTGACVSGSGGDLASVLVIGANGSGLTADITVWEDV